MNEQAIKRVQYLLRFLLVWAVLIVGRLVQLQIFQHDDYRHQALNQQERLVEVQAARGRILDRERQPLAMSILADSVCINPLRVPDLTVAAEILSKILKLDAASLLEKMQLAAADQRGFMWVKRRISEEESRSLRSLNLEWIEFRSEYQRVYPNGPLAAHVVGNVDFDQNGNAGIEQSFNDTLEGHDGEMRVMTDVRQNGFGSQVSNKPLPGRDVVLTIDTRIQRLAEQELAKTILLHRCKTGSIVVLNPKTGDVLAMASYPPFDPNVPVQPNQELNARTNQAITVPFEPGSVFKVVTLATALETTRLRRESPINCGNGSITLFGRTVHEDHRFGMLSMEDVLVHSSNVGAIRIGMTIGAPTLYEYVRKFRFGQRTGIPLPGESPGLLHKLKAWQPTSIGSVPMGHEITVTTLQLAQACAIVANNGFYVRPRITLDTPVADPVTVIKPETAITMRQMMESVVLRGTGRNARLTQYTGGGKTGTAQIVDLKTHRYTHFYNSSFMGFAPVSNPRVVVVVTANGASGHMGFGAEVSAPVYKEVATTALRMLDVPPDLLQDERPSDDKKVDTNDLAIADLGNPPNLDPDADASEASQTTPAPPQPADALQIGPKVPNFRGMSARAVMEQSSSLGIPVEFVGSGLVRTQHPAPGHVLPLGERVRVYSRY